MFTTVGRINKPMIGNKVALIEFNKVKLLPRFTPNMQKPAIAGFYLTSY